MSSDRPGYRTSVVFLISGSSSGWLCLGAGAVLVGRLAGGPGQAVCSEAAWLWTGRTGRRRRLAGARLRFRAAAWLAVYLQYGCGRVFAAGGAGRVFLRW